MRSVAKPQQRYRINIPAAGWARATIIERRARPPRRRCEADLGSANLLKHIVNTIPDYGSTQKKIIVCTYHIGSCDCLTAGYTWSGMDAGVADGDDDRKIWMRAREGRVSGCLKSDFMVMSRTIPVNNGWSRDLSRE